MASITLLPAWLESSLIMGGSPDFLHVEKKSQQLLKLRYSEAVSEPSFRQRDFRHYSHDQPAALHSHLYHCVLAEDQAL